MNPKFLQKNSITAYTQLTSSATAANTAANLLRLIDRNEGTLFVSSGQTVGPWTITWTPSAATSINRMYFQNINWAAFTVKYNTSSNFSPAVNVTGNTSTNLYIEVTSQSVTSITISISSLISGTLAQAGQIYFGTELFEMTALTSGVFTHIPNDKVFIQELSDGTVQKIFVRGSAGWKINLRNVSATEKANYTTLYNYNKLNPFVFIPYPATSSWDGQSNHFNWTNPWDFENFEYDIKDNGYIGNMTLSQACGVG